MGWACLVTSQCRVQGGPLTPSPGWRGSTDWTEEQSTTRRRTLPWGFLHPEAESGPPGSEGTSPTVLGAWGPGVGTPARKVHQGEAWYRGPPGTQSWGHLEPSGSGRRLPGLGVHSRACTPSPQDSAWRSCWPLGMGCGPPGPVATGAVHSLLRGGRRNPFLTSSNPCRTREAACLKTETQPSKSS